MPVWSMANACHDRLAPRPGSANVPVWRIATVLAWVSPAGFTTVPTTVSTPSASSRAMAAAASGVAVIGGRLDAVEARLGARRQGQHARLTDIEGPQDPSHPD